MAWVPGYRREMLRGDVVAGVTVTAYLVPQVMAYAEVAGLPAAVGLSAAVGSLLAYLLLGSSPQLSVGPESTTALMTAAALGSVAGLTGDRYAEFAAALALVVAGVCVVGWLGGLSFLSELLSRPVLVGYMAGIAAIMVVSQLGNFTGISVDAQGFLPELAYVAHHLDEVEGATLAVGLVTLAGMLLLGAVRPHAPVALLGMLAASAAVALLDLEARGVEVIGSVPAGLPAPGLPQVSLDSVLSLVPAALGVAFVGYTDNILTARAFAHRREQRIDARRELLALGAANVGAGLMHGFPVSSSGSRTAIIDSAGGRTQLTGLVAVAATLLAVLTLRPVLEAFPTAALGAVVVYAAVRLVDRAEFGRLGHFRRSELLLALGTTAAVLVVGVLTGILVAVGLSVLDLMRRVARPHDAVEGFVPGIPGMHDIADYAEARPVPGLMIYRYDSPLFFANAEDFHTRARAAVAGSPEPVRWFVLNTEAIVEVDVTAADALEKLRRELTERGVVFGLVRLKMDLRDELAPTGILERIGEDRLFPTLPTAVAAYAAWCRDHPDSGPS
ncbi:SulP family inorganic anion transporter [Nocardioides sp. MAHUQ-72]|uniref:SulP family inorganic anion transporter n=1 Tax=unclassified Nocardioides TaxID=2615069 RepID=UPI00361ABD0A